MYNEADYELVPVDDDTGLCIIDVHKKDEAKTCIGRLVRTSRNYAPSGKWYAVEVPTILYWDYLESAVNFLILLDCDKSTTGWPD